MNWIRRFHHEEEAATAVEYAVLLMLIVGSCITVLQLVGNEAGGFWSGNSDAVEDVFIDTATDLGSGRLK